MRIKIVYGAFGLLLLAPFFYACQGEAEIRKAQFFTNGQSLYAQKCANCHGKQGEGLNQLYPPLNDSSFLKQNQSALACIIKYGLSEEITVNGKKFDTGMPSNNTLSDQEIAYILTYVGNTFGNTLGMISTEEVQQNLSSCK